PSGVINDIRASGDFGKVAALLLQQASMPATLILLLTGLVAFGYIGYETFRLTTIPRQRMYVVLILTFFSMLFWAFFEQAGTSVNLFTDRNVDRVQPERRVTDSDVGKVIRFRIPTESQDPAVRSLPLLTQAQLGHVYGNGPTS